MNQQYFFVQSLSASIKALSNSGALTTIDSVAYAILLVTLIVGIYEAFVAGASVSKLVSSVLKYVIAAGLIANWTSFFTAVYTSSTSIASSIAAKDFVQQFKLYLAQAHTVYSKPTVWNYLTLNIPTLVQGLLFLLVPLLFWFVMLLFELFFTIWGCILFCVGPMLIAVYPSMSISSFAKTYMKSLIEWSSWPILYAIMGALALNVSNGAFSAFATSSGFVDVLSNATSLVMMMLQAVAYILFMIAIPFLAHYILQGSFSDTFAAAVGTAIGGSKAGGKLVAAGAQMVDGAAERLNAAPAGSSGKDNQAPPATAA